MEQVRSDAAELIALNRRFGEWEFAGDGGAAGFAAVLDDSLSFRRSDGSIATKAQFLAGLADPGNVTERIETTVVSVNVLDSQAVVVAVVALKGRRGGRDVDGAFRNIRLFERQGDAWRCVMWFNKPIAST
ncbi:nuclear transport factor 2 family protein [Geodermatophilus sp. SYSU D01186]